MECWSKTKSRRSGTFTESDHNRFSKVIFDKLIELHTVDIQAAGLSEFGKPQGYAERQILGWNKRFANAQTPDVPAFEDVREWLVANIPNASQQHICLPRLSMGITVLTTSCWIPAIRLM